MEKKSFNVGMETLKSVRIVLWCCVLLWLGSCQNANEPKDEGSRIAGTTQEEVLEAVRLDKYLLPNLTYENGAAVVDWSILLDMQYDIRYVEQFEAEIPFPIFNEAIKSLNGKPIIVKGYIIPVEETGESSVVFLSAFPYTECFFCGGAGPESVMDIIPKHKFPRFSLDNQVRFKGILRLNEDDFDFLNYILEEAEIIK
jgi:hypothetical protein